MRTLANRKASNAKQKVIHDDRRARGICINNEAHGAAVKGGRCQACWNVKVAGEKGRKRRRLDPTIAMFPWRLQVHREASFIIRTIRRRADQIIREALDARGNPDDVCGLEDAA